MKGASKDLLNMSISALKKAYSDINDLQCHRAVENVYGGKSDTFGLDFIPEEAIKHIVDDYDSNIVLITEETGKMYHGEKDMEPTQIILVSDPTDRSVKLNQFLTRIMKTNDSLYKKSVHDVLEYSMDEWKKEFGNPRLSGASGSIAAIKNRKILFNAMINYVTGETFVSSPMGNKYGAYNDGIEQFKDIKFFNSNNSEKFATFMGKSGYDENFEKCGLGFDSMDCKDKWAPGPMRILQLSNLNEDNDISFVLSNGEKIGEWMGWLAWVKYAHGQDDPSENTLSAYRIFFENPRTKEHVLVAPAPHYSIFVDEDNETKINLDMMFQLKNPSQYRETLVVAPVHNNRIASIIKARGKEYHQLHLYQTD